MLLAGSETSSTALEWALSLLLNHPEAMKKVQEELDNNVGRDRMINESDLPKLTYLQNVITETLRLFPVIPLLVPHESSKDCKVCGFDIPQGTMLFVNLWSLHRDADLWEDPTRFMPERFEGRRNNEAYNVIPFGAGRRACPGDKMGKRVVGMTLGTLIQCFEWKRIGEKEIVMMEGGGITIPKVEPFIALCKPRDVMENVLLNL